MKYYIKRGEKILGPFDRSQVADFWEKGKVVASDQIANQQNGPFQSLGESIQEVVNPQPAESSTVESSVPPIVDPEPAPPAVPSVSPFEIRTKQEKPIVKPSPPPAARAEKAMTQVPEMTFTERTGNLMSDVKSNFVKSDTVPKVVTEIVGDKAEFRYAARPSNMWFYLQLARIVVVFLVFEMMILTVLGVGKADTVTILIGSLLNLAVFGIAAYAFYLSWINTFFGITDRFIIVRRGFLNRYIAVAEARNVQVININSGIIDRWLGMNTVMFQTAASSGVSPWTVFISSGMVFSNVYLEQVLDAYRLAKGKE